MLNFYFEKLIQRHFEEHEPNSMAARLVLSQVPNRRRMSLGALMSTFSRKRETNIQMQIPEACC